MPLVVLKDISLGFGADPVLDHIDLRIAAGERICLIGRNGVGKSTLLQLLAGRLLPDGGEIQRRQDMTTAYLDQEVPAGAGSVYDRVAEGLGEAGAWLSRYHALSQRLADGDQEIGTELQRLHDRIEAAGLWHLGQRILPLLGRMGLDPAADFGRLSGGWRRRAWLARALVAEPDLLLLDEPANHLDIEAIDWLQGFLRSWRGTLVFVTHDRAFLRGLADRILELDRGRLYDWPGDYDRYLRRKAEAAAAEARQAERQDRLLAAEEAWSRQGIKARRTRNQGRLRRLQRLREERRLRRSGPGMATLHHTEADAGGRRVVVAEGVDFAHGDRVIVRDFSTVILRGDKVGIIGPNGVGKTSLLRLLLGQCRPDRGRVRLGTGLELAYFDQQRETLDPAARVMDVVAQGRSEVEVGGRRRHVLSYLQDFLFDPARARQPVASLSGGERNRLLLARLFTRPFNLLVMDEPTNDLDMETLELLEALLVDFTGTLLLVSHDRAFLDNTVTSTLVFEGDGRVGEYVGGYSDWLRQRPSPAADGRPAAAAPRARRPRPAEAGHKLSYHEVRELEALPARIEALESEQARLHERLADPAFYREAGAAVAEVRDRLAELERELAQAFERWERLEARPR